MNQGDNSAVWVSIPYTQGNEEDSSTLRVERCLQHYNFLLFPPLEAELGSRLVP
jgi:hypothetical protein